MDILLVDPPYIALKGVPVEAGYTVGLTSLAAYLRNGGIEAAVVMGDLLMGLPVTNMWLTMDLKKFAAGQHQYSAIVGDESHAVWGRLKDVITRSHPMAVGIACLTPSKLSAERVASVVKGISPDIKVIAGSAHPTACPQEVMRDPHIDFVVAGEGEIPLLSLLRELKKDSPRWDTVPGIYYRDSEGQVRRTPPPPLFDNLDALPFLARDLALDCDYGRYRVHSLSATRGCPYRCSFCADRKLWGGKVRRRSVQNVIDEMKQLESTYKVDYLDIVDGTFTFDRKYLQAFCNAVVTQKVNIKWRCTARYSDLDEGLVQLMKQSHCEGIYFGLESGSDRVLKVVDKGISVDQIARVSRMVYKSGIPSATGVLLGIPGEGKADMEETLALMRRVKTDIYDVNVYTPLPGTPLYDAMSEEERGNIDWAKTGFKSFETYFAKDMSPEEFGEYRNKAYRIAENVRKKTIARWAIKMVLQSVSQWFAGLGRKLTLRKRTA